MKAELLQVSHQEQSRSEIMGLYVEDYIKQKDAARRMNLSTRQDQRLARGVPPVWKRRTDSWQPWQRDNRGSN